MDFAFTPEQIAFRREIREWLDHEITPDMLRRSHRGSVGAYGSEEIKQKLIDRGWFMVHWPKEEGGAGWSPMELAIFHEELGYTLIGSGGLINVAENIKLYGTEEQKHFFLPRFARGEINFTLGLSEPNAGVDAANVSIHAKLEGDEFVINGQKMWGGSGRSGYAKDNWHWLIARTDREAPRHRGISILLVPLETEGITIRPVWTMGSDDDPVAAIYYDNVRVPRSALLGEMNRGWYQLMTGLDVLRSSIGTGYLGECRRYLDDLRDYLRAIQGSGRLVADSQAVRHRLVELQTNVETLWCLAYHIASLEQKGRGGAEDALVPPSSLSYMIKIWAADQLQQITSFGQQLMGYHGIVPGPEADRWHDVGEHMERAARYTRQISIGGGSTEVLRNQIATRVLGLPR